VTGTRAAPRETIASARKFTMPGARPHPRTPGRLRAPAPAAARTTQARAPAANNAKDLRWCLTSFLLRWFPRKRRRPAGRQVLTDLRGFGRTGLAYERVRTAMGNGLAELLRPAFSRSGGLAGASPRQMISIARSSVTGAAGSVATA
jgi:hypothetical protein